MRIGMAKLGVKLGSYFLASLVAVILGLLGFIMGVLFFEFITNYNMFSVSNVSYCEGVNASTLDNNYWKIESIKTNMWRVLFRNVGITYEIRQCVADTDVQTSLFEFREIGPNYPGVFDADFLLKMTTQEMLDYWAKNNQGIEYVENGNGALYLVGSADKKYVYVCKDHNNIVDATMEHFNSIQRGDFHPDAENKINPNSHGKGTNVLGNVKNTFGVHNSDVWPADKNKGDGDGGAHGHASILPLLAASASKPKSPQNNKSTTEDSNIKDTKSGKTINRDIRSPLDQFLIIDLIIIILPLLAFIQLSLTNMALNLGISTLTIITVYVLPLLWEKVRTSPWFISTVSILHTVYNFVRSQIQIIKGINFLPFFACLFLFILVNNLIGMIPYTFAPTSHFILTFFISFSIVLGCSFLGFIIHKLRYFSLLTPQGCPLGLLPLLVLIETISYLARNVSLGLRLAANILSGHMLLNILSEFTYKIMDTDIIYFFIAMIPLMFIGGFSALELGIAFIQSQVFVVLSSSYTKDSLELH